MEDKQLYEDVAMLKANDIAMKESLTSLAVSVAKLSDTVGSLSKTIWMAMGGFGVVMFIIGIASNYFIRK